MEIGRLTNGQLRVLCIKNNWFTDGTNDQYDKLMEANNQKAPIGQIATIIRVCSDPETVCRRDIIVELNNAGFTAREDKSERDHLYDWLGI